MICRLLGLPFTGGHGRFIVGSPSSQWTVPASSPWRSRPHRSPICGAANRDAGGSRAARTLSRTTSKLAPQWI